MTVHSVSAMVWGSGRSSSLVKEKFTLHLFCLVL